jgi:hypothetical protein
LEELRDFELINATVSWFESLDTDEKKNATQYFEEYSFGCIGDLYDQGIENKTITDDTLLTNEILFDVAFKCIDIDIISEILEFYTIPELNHIPVDKAANDGSLV